MSQLKKKWIGNNEVGAAKVRLENGSPLRGRNAADDGDVEILTVNGSDRVVFTDVPQVTADAVSANDLVRLSQVQSLLEGLKPKEAVRLLAASNVVIADELEPGDLIDNVVIDEGDRILLVGQTDLTENGIYVVQASGPALRSADMNLSEEFPGAYTLVSSGDTAAGQGYVCSVAEDFILGTDDATFVLFKASVDLVAGDGIDISGATISADLSATGALEFQTGEIAINLEASNPTLEINGSNELKVKFASTTLEQGASGLSVKLATDGAIGINSGLTVITEGTNPSLQISANELGLKMDTVGALQKGAGGVSVKVDNSTIAINNSNNLEGLKAYQGVITLDSTDITNGYVDLDVPAQSAASIQVIPVGGPVQQPTADYTVSLTGGTGGVTRITFAGDLESLLEDGDVLIIRAQNLNE